MRVAMALSLLCWAAVGESMAPAQARAQFADAATGWVFGTVRDADTSAPLAGVEIGSNRLGWTKTDSAGRYRLENAIAGPAWLIVRFTSFSSSPTGVMYVTVRPRQGVENADFYVRLFGQIAGRVKTADGAGVSGVSVVAVAMKYGRTGGLPGEIAGQELNRIVVASAVTNAAGDYVLSNVPAGRNHLILAIPPKDRVIVGEAIVQKDRRLAFVPTYFPTSTSILGGIGVSVASNGETSGTDVILATVEPHCLALTIDSPARSVAARLDVRVEHEEVSLLRTIEQTAAFSWKRNIAVGASGNLKICGLSSGTYVVDAGESLDAPMPGFRGSVRVSVERETAAHLDIYPPVAVRTRSILLTESGNVPIDERVSLRLWPPALRYDGDSSAPVHAMEVGESYALVVARLRPNEYVSDVRLRNVSVLRTAIVATPLEANAQLEVHVRADAAIVRARVERLGASGGAWIVIVPAYESDEAELLRVSRASPISQDGSAMFLHLPPGDYCGFATRRAPPAVVSQPAGVGMLDRTPEVARMLRSWRSSGRCRSVGGGAETNMVVPMLE